MIAYNFSSFLAISDSNSKEKDREASFMAVVLLFRRRSYREFARSNRSAAPPNPLGEVNSLFLNEYGARIDAITQVHPLYVEVSGDNLILHRNGQEESKRVLPDIYHALKNVSHVPLLLYLKLAPLSSSQQISRNRDCRAGDALGEDFRCAGCAFDKRFQ